MFIKMFVIQKLQVSHLTRFAMSHEKSDYWPHYIQSRFKQKRAAVEIKWLYGFLLTAKILEIFNYAKSSTVDRKDP